ncbi:family 16 glycoside hydrolase [Formosa sp. L2A11]|uniref:family 16 glycoside hydrolase n=1 Tax=Formosa sp. L2A11 TaxID=2686363 RepID=UPI00131D3593|nr:family 16 glycoside hydrolase [Formosa sp. L2A11]
MKAKQLRPFILLVGFLALNVMVMNGQSDPLSDNGFVEIFNGENWDGWHLKLRNGDAQQAKKAFAIENEEVHVFKNMPDSLNLNTGENATHGLFYTNKEYSNYILRFQYKWGEKITNNFDRWQYDAGVYYHVTDDKVWPIGIEYQIRYNQITNNNHTGDLIRPSGAGYDWVFV